MTLAPMCAGRGASICFLAHDQIGRIEGRQLEAMSVGNRIGRTGLHAVAAKDAAVIVDVIDLGIPLGADARLLGGILGGLYIDAIRRAGGSAEKAGHAFFQTILVALQNVRAAKALLDHRAPLRAGTVGIILHLDRLEDLSKVMLMPLAMAAMFFRTGIPI